MNRRKHKEYLKKQIWTKTAGVCAKCGREVDSDKRTIDHFIPKYHGGTDDIRNLIPLCKACNKAKGSRIMDLDECCPYMLDDYKDFLEEYKRDWNNHEIIGGAYEPTILQF